VVCVGKLNRHLENQNLQTRVRRWLDPTHKFWRLPRIVLIFFDVKLWNRDHTYLCSQSLCDDDDGDPVREAHHRSALQFESVPVYFLDFDSAHCAACVYSGRKTELSGQTLNQRPILNSHLRFFRYQISYERKRTQSTSIITTSYRILVCLPHQQHGNCLLARAYFSPLPLTKTVLIYSKSTSRETSRKIIVPKIYPTCKKHLRKPAQLFVCESNNINSECDALLVAWILR